MTRIYQIAVLMAISAPPSLAETVVAKTTIRPQQIIEADDLGMSPVEVPGALHKFDQALGKEARIAIYAGRAVMKTDIGEPTLINRNDMVEIVFQTGSLRISAEGRALGRGSVGERIRFMNISSKAILFGTVTEAGAILVSK